jgi:hypothetical protein
MKTKDILRQLYISFFCLALANSFAALNFYFPPLIRFIARVSVRFVSPY